MMFHLGPIEGIVKQPVLAFAKDANGHDFEIVHRVWLLRAPGKAAD
jgi:hypothetical protein